MRVSVFFCLFSGTSTSKGILVGSNAGVMSVDFDSTGSLIVGSSYDYASRVWTLSDLRLRVSLALFYYCVILRLTRECTCLDCTKVKCYIYTFVEFKKGILMELLSFVFLPKVFFVLYKKLNKYYFLRDILIFCKMHYFLLAINKDISKRCLG